MKVYDLFFYAAVFTGVALMIAVSVTYVARRRKAIKLGSVDRNRIFTARTEKVMSFVGKRKNLSALVKEMSLRISAMNTKSREYNDSYAVMTLAAGFILTTVFAAVITAATFPLWYFGAVYTLFFAGGLCLGFIGLTEIFRSVFIGNMPETLRILNSRYTSRGNIMKAIYASMEDFHPAVKREMVRIYDALKQNDMAKIRETFAETEEKYSGEYVTLMLELIDQAYYNGGDEVVKVQFDAIAEDVIFELENKKDVRQAATGYIIMALAFILFLPAAAAFNNGILGKDSAAFYSGMKGAVYTVVFFALVFLLILTIVLLERTEK